MDKAHALWALVCVLVFLAVVIAAMAAAAWLGGPSLSGPRRLAPWRPAAGRTSGRPSAHRRWTGSAARPPAVGGAASRRGRRKVMFGGATHHLVDLTAAAGRPKKALPAIPLYQTSHKANIQIKWSGTQQALVDLYQSLYDIYHEEVDANYWFDAPPAPVPDPKRDVLWTTVYIPQQDRIDEIAKKLSDMLDVYVGPCPAETDVADVDVMKAEAIGMANALTAFNRMTAINQASNDAAAADAAGTLLDPFGKRVVLPTPLPDGALLNNAFIIAINALVAEITGLELPLAAAEWLPAYVAPVGFDVVVGALPNTSPANKLKLIALKDFIGVIHTNYVNDVSKDKTLDYRVSLDLLPIIQQAANEFITLANYIASNPKILTDYANAYIAYRVCVQTINTTLRNHLDALRKTAAKVDLFTRLCGVAGSRALTLLILQFAGIIIEEPQLIIAPTPSVDSYAPGLSSLTVTTGTMYGTRLQQLISTYQIFHRKLMNTRTWEPEIGKVQKHASLIAQAIDSLVKHFLTPPKESFVADGNALLAACRDSVNNTQNAYFVDTTPAPAPPAPPGRFHADAEFTALKTVIDNFPPFKASPDIGSPPAKAVAVAKPLTESQKLIHYTTPPTESVAVVEAGSAGLAELAAAPAGGVAIIEAADDKSKTSVAKVDEIAAALPRDGGPRDVYVLVVDKPGDMAALRKAAAMSLKLKAPDRVQSAPSDRKKGATGWLYRVVRQESGEYYNVLVTYVNTALYDV